MVAAITVAVVLTFVLGRFAVMARLSRERSPDVGVTAEGRLPACPGSPNCVSSEEGTPQGKRVEPLQYRGDRDATRAHARAVVGSMPRVEIVDEGEGYLHAEARTALFGFIDDLELRFDDEAGLVHVRSASRAGYSDLGANRKRVDELRRQWDPSR